MRRAEEQASPHLSERPPASHISERPPVGELVLPLPAPPAALAPVTKVRSTLITSSLRALEERGLAARYFGLVAPEHREEIRSAIAGVWLPVHLAVAHYRACDALGLSTAEQVDMGRRVGDKIQGTLLGTLVTLAKQAGASPWTFLVKLDRLYERLAVGGGISVSRLADKDALVEIYKVPTFETSYFTVAFRGVISGICDLFCTKAYVKSGRHAHEKMTYTISWA